MRTLNKKSEKGKFKKGHIAWNKGLRGWTKGTNAGFQKRHGKLRKFYLKGNHPKTEFKRGHPAPKTAFKKGFIPWNKGIRWGRMKGKNNPAWKGGIISFKKLIRQTFEYRQWRSDIFTRDDFTCQKCGERGGKLEVDHYPKMFSTILEEYKIKTFEEALICEELWNINNGRTLCKKCHYLTETYGGRKKD